MKTNRSTAVRDVWTWSVGDEPEDMGTRGKEWLVEPDTQPEIPWLFKAVRRKVLQDGRVRYFGEDWAELLATEAAKMLGIPAAHVELAVRNQECGVISRSLLVDADGCSIADSLDHGNELLQARNPRYDKAQTWEATGYTLDAVWGVLNGIAAPADTPSPVTTAGDTFAGYLVLDALVAGTDRHHENWGVLSRGSRRWLAPTFDHGTCLGFQNEDQRRLMYLDGKSSATMSGWVARGKSNHFEGRPNLVELARAALERLAPPVRQHWLDRVSTFSLEDWTDTVNRVPESWMSQPARRFACEVVRLNRDRILQ